jgi:hypothetical protein
LRGADDGGFQVDKGPDPGPGDNVLAGIAPTSNDPLREPAGALRVAQDLWAVGIFKENGRQPFIERHASENAYGQ